MSVHPWHDVPLPADCADWFPAYIEIPKGSNIKYELDKPTGLLIVDRVLYSTVYYPANYGFVPRTWCDDGDPLDVLVLGDEPVVPQALMRARAIGVMRMRDDKGQDDKIIAVHVDDAEYSHYRDVSELPSHRMRQLPRFFKDYKILEEKMVTVDDPLGAADAIPILQEAITAYTLNRNALIAGGHPNTDGTPR
jgi:inorganic pyrophosphatase